MSAQKLVAEIEADIRGLKKGVDEAKAKLKELNPAAEAVTGRFEQSMSKIGSRISGFGDTMTKAGLGLTFGVSMPLMAFGKQAVEASNKLDGLSRGLTAIMGGAAQANKEMVRLRDVAKLPGLGYAEAIQGSIRLQSVGVSADKAAAGMKAFGNAIATIGGGKVQFDAVTYQLGQMFGAGKLQGDEIRSITDAIPRLRQVLKDAYGTTDTKTINAKASVQQIYDTIVKGLAALPTITSGAKVQLENVMDDMLIVMAKFGDAITPVLVKIADVAVPMLMDLAEWFKALDPGVKQAIVSFGLFLAIAGPISLSIGGIATVVGGLVTFIGSLGVPLALVAAAMAAFGVAFATNWNGVRDAAMPVIEEIKKKLLELHKWLSDEAPVAWKTFSDGMAAFWESVRPGVEQFGSALKDAGTYLGEWWADSSNVFKIAWEDFKNTMMQGGQYITDAWNLFGKDWWEALKKNMMAIIEVITWAGKTIMNLVKGVLALLSGQWGEAWDALVDIVKDTFESIKKVMDGFLYSFVDFFRGVWNIIQHLGAITWEMMRDVGGNMMRGMAEGVQGSVDRVNRAITNAVEGVVNIAKNVLGIRSPSKEFQTIGHQLVEGLTLGIMSMAPFATKAMADLSSKLITDAIEKYKEFVEVMNTIGAAKRDEVLEIKKLIAVTDEEKTSLDLLKVSYSELSSEQQQQIDNLIAFRKIRDGLSNGNIDLEGPSKSALDTLKELIKIQGVVATSGAYKKFSWMPDNLLGGANDNVTRSMSAITKSLAKAKGEWTEIDEIASEFGITLSDLNGMQYENFLVLVGLKNELSNWEIENEKLKQYQEAVARTSEAIADVIKDSFMDAYENGFTNFFTNVYQGFQKLLYQMAVDYLKSQLVQLLMRNVGGLVDLIGIGVGASGGGKGTTTPNKSLGGDVTAGRAYYVGESGKEMFIPRRDGSIVSNHNLKDADAPQGSRSSTPSQSMVFTYAPTYNITTPDAESFRKSQRQHAVEAEGRMREMARRLK